MTVKNLQFCNGVLRYKGFILEQTNRIVSECFGEYIETQWGAGLFGSDDVLIASQLGLLLQEIDLKLEISK